jgi:hypothetical protein
MPRLDLLAACLVMLGGRPAAAQSQAILRFVPDLGRVTRTLTEVRTTTTLVGFPAVPDRAAFEEESWISVTQRVARMGEDGAVVEVTVDSIRGRVRLGGEVWTDYADTSLIGRAAQAIVSPRFGVVGIRSTGPRDGEILQALGAFAAGLDFVFPEAPVTAGETFATGGRLRARVRTDSVTGLAIDEVVFGDLSLTLDSAVQAGGEELAYLHSRGATIAHRGRGRRGRGRRHRARGIVRGPAGVVGAMGGVRLRRDPDPRDRPNPGAGAARRGGGRRHVGPHRGSPRPSLDA